MRYDVCVIAAIIAACSTVGSRATAQQTGSNQQAVTAEPASNPDQELGRRFLIKAENLPPPKSGSIAASRSLVVPYAGQAPRVMEGFTATRLSQAWSILADCLFFPTTMSLLLSRRPDI